MNNKGAVKIFSLIFIFLFSISFASAWEWDNKLSYEKNDMKVIFENAYGLPLIGYTFGEIELKSHSNITEIKRVTRGEDRLVMYYDFTNWDKYSNGLGKVYFTNMRNGDEIEKDYYLAKAIYEDILINDYKESCSNKILSNDSIEKNCIDEIVGTHLENKLVRWEKIKNNDIPQGNNRIGLFTDVLAGEHIDGVWTIAGKKVSKHSEWTEDLNNGLVSYYTLNETTGTGDVFDSLGLNNATIENGGTQGVEGIINNSVSLTTTQFIDIPDSTTIDGNQQQSINFWYKGTDTTGLVFVSKGFTGDFQYIIDGSASNNLRMIAWDSSGTDVASIIVSTPQLYDNSWHMVTGVWNNTDNLLMYLDGINIGNDSTWSGTWNYDGSFNLSIGRALNKNGKVGNYDEIGYWNRTLSSDEIVQLYNNGSAITFKDEFINIDVIQSFPEDNFKVIGSPANVNLGCNFSSVEQNISSVKIDVYNSSNFLSFTETNNSINDVSFNKTWTTIPLTDGIYNWSCHAFGSLNINKSTGNRTFFIDGTAPQINLTFPRGQIDIFKIGNNLTINWTVADTNLESCFFNYNNINTSVICVANNFSFTPVINVQNLTFFANDSFGNSNNNFTSWNYLLLELNQTFNTPVIELSDENFELNIQASETITQVLLNYNGTNFVSNILSLGGGLNKITTTIQIPSFDVNSNVTFFYNISTSSVSGIITQEQMQEVRILNVGNCTAFSNLLMNLSLFDEKTLESINGTIEFDLEILNPSDDSILNKLSTIFEDISTVSVCADLNLSAGNYIYSLELRYFSQAFNSTTFSHVPEFYHIQKADVSGLPQIINLYDLAVNESTEFTISYRDDNYLARENVLLQIQRKYVAEGIFRVIEIPITSSEGQAVGHFDLNNYKYKITVTQDGEVLNVFDNPSIRCESELSGICEIILKGSAPTPSADFVSDLENFFYTITQTNNSVIVDFTIPTGESKLVNIEMVQTSAFTDPIIICNQSILSSAGQIECEITPSIGDSSVDINIVSDGTPKGLLKATFQEDLNASFLLNNYFIGAIMLMTLILMFVSSPQLMIGASVFGLVFLGMIFLLKSSTIGLGLGAIAWLIVSSVIILSKLNKKAEQ